ncbi:MAG: 50S ribosomal protein L22 [Phycisphaerales bacterium]|nr:50S ribosomal protein L22 [Phycisphaerales bacterium]
MKINTKRFNQAAKAAGLGSQELGAVLPKPDGAGQKHDVLAERKVRNWMEGRFHPKPKAVEIAAMAQALGVTVPSIVRFTSMHRFARSSDRKSGLMVELIRGKSVDDARHLLAFSPRRAAKMVNKVLGAAIADAEAAQADTRRLYVSEATADAGVIIKRFQPKDRGRAHPIQKKTSHITVSVEERA